MVDLVSPVKGYATSEYGWRILGGQRVFHAGLDIATGGVSAPVYAMYDGTIEDIVRDREPGQPASRGRVIAPGRSGNAPKVRNGDGERQIYGHVLTAIGWRVGDRVKAGQLLGYTDLSGNTSGFHCHLEAWNSNGTTRNPRLDFRAAGVLVGSAPKKIGTVATQRRYPAVAMTRNSSWADLSYAWGIWLGSHGYTGNRYERIQKWLNNRGADLLVDGDIGPRTITAWQRIMRDLHNDGRARYGVTVITGRIGGLGSEFRTAIAAYANDRRSTAQKG